MTLAKQRSNKGGPATLWMPERCGVRKEIAGLLFPCNMIDVMYILALWQAFVYGPLFLDASVQLAPIKSMPCTLVGPTPSSTRGSENLNLQIDILISSVWGVTCFGSLRGPRQSLG